MPGCRSTRSASAPPPSRTPASSTCARFKLKELSLYRNTNLTDAGLRHLQDQTKLETLMLRGVKYTADGFAHLKGLTALRTLNASLSMNDASMTHLKGMTNLKVLMLYSNPGLTDAGLAHIKDLKQIERLSLQFTGITDAGLGYAEHLPNLRFLDVRGTKIDPGTVDRFRQAHPDCKVYR